MISFDQARKALDAAGITMSNLQLHRFLAELLPNPQCGFSVSGVVVYGDRQSIEKVREWNHSAASIPSWRRQFDGMQQRAMRAEELGIQMLAFIASIAASNPAHNASAALAGQFLEDRGIEPHEGFFHDQAAALMDARSKFYAAAHPRD